MKPTHTASLFVAALLSLALVACGKKEPAAPAPAAAPAPTPAAAPAPDLVNAPVAVKNIVLGNALGEQKHVATAMDSFAPKDIIYAVVETVGSGKAKLKAAWTYHKGDKVAPVNETVQEIDVAGPANSEFHVSKPDGWPKGDYQVELFLNDASVGVRKFSVK
jgi:hypothetical protein